MHVNRIAATVIAAAALTACSGPNGRDLHQALKSAGCVMSESQYQRLPGRIVLSISVMGCAVSDNFGGSRLLTSTETMALIERTAWSVSPYWFDTLFVTNSVAAPSGRSEIGTPKEISRDELKVRFGQRNPDLDTAPPASVVAGSAAIPWIVIPPLAAILGLTSLVGLVRANRRGSMLVMLTIR